MMKSAFFLRVLTVFATWIVAVAASAELGAAEPQPPSLPPSPSPSRPNLLILLADDLGYSDLGCYGGEIATPHLDALAKNGLRFTQFYNTARCWPSRAAILTGYYAQQTRRDALPGVPNAGNQGKRPPWAKLLPEMLKSAGYRSYHSGKWHVDGPRLAGGFDRSYSLEDHNRNFAPRNHNEDDKPLPAVKPGDSYFTSTAIADHAIRCLKDHEANHKGRPFFQYVAFTSPHFPLQAPAADIAKYRDVYRKGWDAVREERWRRMKAMGLIHHQAPKPEREVGPPYDFPDAMTKLGPGEVNRPLPWSELTEEQQAFQAAKMAIHAAMIDRMDQEIGRILDQTRSMGALDNTIIMFLSDNGASAEIMVRGDGHDRDAPPGSASSYLCLGPGWSTACNTPFRRHKTWVHEGGVSTPMVVHWPKGIAAQARGELRHRPGHVIDIVPTILDAASASLPAEGRAPAMPGRSLKPAFAADGPMPHPYLWWLHEGNRAVRVGDWKLVAAGAKGPWELYDLSSDRGESQDLAARRPEKVRELERVWQAATDQFRADVLGRAAP